MEILLRIKRAKGERRGGESDERCHTSAIRKVYHSISFDPSLNSRTEILPDECPNTKIPFQTVIQVAR
jgi:hypothetical protein